jgi:hypothetical protein
VNLLRVVENERGHGQNLEARTERRGDQ